MLPRIYTFKLLTVLWAVALCSPLTAVTKYTETDVQNGGNITGTVRLLNYDEKPFEVPVKKDAQHCGQPKYAGCLAISKDGGLANAVVYLENIARGKKMMPRDTQITLDQKSCEYVPHVAIVPVGSNLEIANSDPILHNVHAYNLQKPPVNPASRQPATEFNIALPLKGFKIPRAMKEPGKFLTLCDAGHPWMSAHVFVVEHPYYAVSDANGKFLLDKVPPGKYKVQVWHEGRVKFENGRADFFGTQPYVTAKEVSVPAKGNVTLNFDLK